MKFNFKPSPNYRDGQSTGRIMGELTLGLLAVFAFSLYYYFTIFSASYGLRAILIDDHGDRQRLRHGNPVVCLYEEGHPEQLKEFLSVGDGDHPDDDVPTVD